MDCLRLLLRVDCLRNIQVSIIIQCWTRVLGTLVACHEYHLSFTSEKRYPFKNVLLSPPPLISQSYPDLGSRLRPHPSPKPIRCWHWQAVGKGGGLDKCNFRSLANVCLACLKKCYQDKLVLRPLSVIVGLDPGLKSLKPTIVPVRERRRRQRRQNTIGFISTDNSSVSASRFLVHSLTSTARLRLETSWCNVSWSTWTYNDEFSILFLNLDKILKNSTPEKIVCI